MVRVTDDVASFAWRTAELQSSDGASWLRREGRDGLALVTRIAGYDGGGIAARFPDIVFCRLPDRPHASRDLLFRVGITTPLPLDAAVGTLDTELPLDRVTSSGRHRFSSTSLRLACGCEFHQLVIGPR